MAKEEEGAKRCLVEEVRGQRVQITLADALIVNILLSLPKIEQSSATVQLVLLVLCICT